MEGIEYGNQDEYLWYKGIGGEGEEYSVYSEWKRVT